VADDVTQNFCNLFERKHRNNVPNVPQFLRPNVQTAPLVPKDSGTTLHQKVWKNMPKDTTPHPTRRILKFSNVLESFVDIQDIRGLIQSEMLRAMFLIR
jgi:hypothetical protein